VLVDAATQPTQLVGHGAVAHGAVDGQRQSVHRNRLGDEVVSARAHGADGVLERAEAGHDDDDQVGPLGERSATQVEPAHAFHVNVD
jgi:hypothetical protein